MSLQDKLDAFRANFEAGGPPYNAPAWIHEPMHRATDELIACGAVRRDDSWTLPMPARFVIGQDGSICYAEVNPDYTRRPDPEELLPVLERLPAAA